MKSFLDTYQNLNINNLHTLREIYTDNIRFIDPAHEVEGIEHLTSYFQTLYKNIDSIEFVFSEPLEVDSCGYVRWEMTFSHKRLAHGKFIQIEGVTYLKFDTDGRVWYHRDYFDLGAMLYEHIPLLGRLVTSIKRGLGK